MTESDRAGHSTDMLRTLFSIGLISILIGCGGRVHVGDTDGGADGGADGAIRDGGPADGSVECGRVTCPEGMVCCNASCGVCTAPSGSCPAIACIDECTSDADCRPGDVCAWDVEGCGTDPGTCQPRPGSCSLLLDPVCGCDGVEYGNACEALRASARVASHGACGTSPCSPQDAMGVGPCFLILGVAWDGTTCVSVGGCECDGADCGSLYPDLETCQSAHAGCAGCEAMDAHGEGLCAAILGVAWDGARCDFIGGCDCVGTDCGALYTTTEECQAARGHCAMPCDGLIGAACPAWMWCDYEDGHACGLDVGGNCRPRPEECSLELDPVCGCDGSDYSNACEAQRAGTEYTPGPCPPPP